MEAEEAEGRRIYPAVLALAGAAAPNQCTGSSLSLGREVRDALHHISLLQLNNCTSCVIFCCVAGLITWEYGRTVCVCPSVFCLDFYTCPSDLFCGTETQWSGCSGWITLACYLWRLFIHGLPSLNHSICIRIIKSYLSDMAWRC